MTELAAPLALRLMDLTRLETDDDESAVRALCRRAATPFGTVAAVCVYARFIAAAREALDEQALSERVQIATVVNFPDGSANPEQVALDIRQALEAGADEIDLVFPWRSLYNGDEEAGRSLVMAAREVCGEHVLKVILETGELADAHLIRKAAGIAIESGADFVKTSTGKVAVNATPEAARILLETIRDSGRNVGCKVAGGIRTTEQALGYLGLAADIMGAEWIDPMHFRIGASGLLDDLLARLGTDEAAGGGPGAY